MNFIQAKCPACGGELHISDTIEDKFYCQYCGSLIFVEQAVSLAKSGAAYTRPEDFVVIGGVLEKYNGESRDIVIPGNVVVIGKNVFSGTAIRSVSVPSSVRKIDYGAFANCDYLELVRLSNGVEEIDYYAFYSNFTSMSSSINIPASVRSLGQAGMMNKMFPKENHVTLTFEGIEPKIPASQIMYTGANAMVMNEAHAKELAKALVLEAAHRRTLFGTVFTFDKWDTRQVVVPGRFDYLSSVDSQDVEPESEDIVFIDEDGHIVFDDYTCCAKSLVETFLSYDEHMSICKPVWIEEGRCPVCGGDFVTEKKRFGGEVTKCEFCGSLR